MVSHSARPTVAEVIEEADSPGPTTPRKRPRVFSSSGEDSDDDHQSCGISIHTALSTLLYSEKFSDMTISCQGHEFKAHCAVVCTQSSFFDEAMTSNFKEATTRIVDLPEDDPDILERFLEFLYTGTYTDGVNSTWGKPSATAMMDPKTIGQKLQDPACGEQYLSALHENASCDDHDRNWQSPSEETEESEEGLEGSEEEYDEDSPATSDEYNDVEELHAKTMETIASLPSEDGLRALANLRYDMTLPLRLYVMVDKYDVPALKLLARNRFYRAAELVWREAEYFPDIVDELYETTPPSDTAMREIVCRLVGMWILDPHVREKLRPVMAKHGEFAVGVMEYAIHSKAMVG